LLIEVVPADAAALEQALRKQTITRLGAVTQRARIQVSSTGVNVLDLAVAQLVGAWKCETIS